jgi:hypothetical protein
MTIAVSWRKAKTGCKYSKEDGLMHIFMLCCHLLEQEFEVKVQYISVSWKTEVSALTEMNLK